MSHQYLSVFDRVFTSCMFSGYILDLSAPQRDSLGQIVGDIYYKRPSLLQVGINHLSGFPHNGGQHTLRIQGSRKDLIAWLDLVIETYRAIKFDRFQHGADTLECIRQVVMDKPDR